VAVAFKNGVLPVTPTFNRTRMKQEELGRLLDKYFSGTPLTAEETARLRAWDAQFEKEEGLDDSFGADEKIQMRQKMWEHVSGHTGTPVVPLQNRKGRLSWPARVAAAAILVVLAGGGWWLVRNGTQQQPEARVAAQDNNILPGGNKAVLTLADGSTIILDSAGNGLLAQQGNATISKLDNGAIAYKAGTGPAGETLYNTITTPPGGQFLVVLPDGSKVMLNAASSLRYPAQFAANERRVTLTGEGYFEVVHDARQTFIVSVGGMEVHDLGTEFNINAYADEPFIQTSLVSGLAEVKSSTGLLKLQPGKAAQVTAGTAKLVDADLEAATAWKNGLFVFGGSDIQTIMRQVARWYDVELEFKSGFNKRFYGTISRNEPVSKVFSLLELTGDVHFRTEGRKIIVMP